MTVKEMGPAVTTRRAFLVLQMDWKLFAQLGVTLVVAVLGSWLVHHLSASRDLANERRKLRISYLLDAYRGLEASANRPDGTAERRMAFESAIADIQLLGTRDQIEATLKYVREHAQGGGAIIDPVLEAFRIDLRQELGLHGDTPRILVFRFKTDES